ncbi:DUF167 family protein [Candidatus Nitrosacidococcus tergens]|uniref:UPF0235 protein NSCAC_1694 n=1 Tax=Candidatus Nitrosacidococcus tergens TaxID=553981 RepID=A0A7G1QBL6_9GAMM|nr:DUF167 family protein [Candidatus Nitrosacidococcus tergens]CAB1277489.1 conserved hypothetical protein [Candidatus Nitrosacidococcus tergens]
MIVSSWFDRVQDGIIVRIRLQPNARRNEILGIHANQLKIKITAPPIEGKANLYLINFLSKLFEVNKSRIDIVAGAMSRDKQIRIAGITTLPLELRSKLGC